MKTFNSFKCAAVLVPALALGIPMAYASDEKRNDPCEPDRSTAMTGMDHHRSGQRDDWRDDQRDDRRDNQRQQDQRGQQDQRFGQQDQRGQSSEFFQNKPARGFHSDNLVGQDVKSRRNNESVGTVSNLVVDHDGQVVAVVIGVGGLMGIGERDVAISWDQIERRTDGDETTLWVNLTEQALNNAPEYSSDRSSDRSSGRTTTRRQ